MATNDFDVREELARLRQLNAELCDALTAIAKMLFERPDMVKALRLLRGPAEDAVFYMAANALNKARGRKPA